MKGIGNRVYIALYYRITSLDSNIKLSIPEYIPAPEGTTVVFCEGKTDPLHLETALSWFHQQGKFSDLDLHFFKWRSDLDINNDTLLQMCQTRPQAKRDNRIEIYLFDRDVPRYIQKAAEKINLTNIGKQMSIQRSFLFRNTVISTKYA